MVVDSTISASGEAYSSTPSWTRLLAPSTPSPPPCGPTTSAAGEAYSSTPSWTRLLAQTTTSAPPMSFAPRIVSRSGEPGPAPINQTLPKPFRLSGKDDRRQVRPLPPVHPGRRDDFFAGDPEPGPVARAPRPPRPLRRGEHLRHPVSALVTDDG